MSDKPIPELWEKIYAALKPLAEKEGASFQFARDKCALIEEVGELRARVTELEQALERYGYHDEGCPADTIKDGQCLCGLDAALAALPVTDKAVKP